MPTSQAGGRPSLPLRLLGALALASLVVGIGVVAVVGGFGQAVGVLQPPPNSTRPPPQATPMPGMFDTPAPAWTPFPQATLPGGGYAPPPAWTPFPQATLPGGGYVPPPDPTPDPEATFFWPFPEETPPGGVLVTPMPFIFWGSTFRVADVGPGTGCNVVFVYTITIRDGAQYAGQPAVVMLYGRDYPDRPTHTLLVGQDGTVEVPYRALTCGSGESGVALVSVGTNTAVLPPPPSPGPAQPTPF